MPNLRQASGHPAQLSLQDGQQGQQQVVQQPGLPPLAQKMQLMPKVPEGQVPKVPQNSLLHNQIPAPLQPTMHPQIQHSQHAKNQVLRQTTLPGQSTVPTFPSIHPSIRPQIQVGNSSSLNQQIQPSSLDNQVRAAASSLEHNTWTNLPNVAIQSSFMPRPPTSNAGFQVPKFPIAS